MKKQDRIKQFNTNNHKISKVIIIIIMF